MRTMTMRYVVGNHDLMSCDSPIAERPKWNSHKQLYCFHIPCGKES